MNWWRAAPGTVIAVLLAGAPGAPARADSAESHHAAAMDHLRAGRSQEALTELRDALRLDHDHLPSLVQMADLLSASNRVFEAYGVLQHAVAVAPESAEVHALRGRCFSRLDRWSDAREELRRALELDPALLEPYYGLALAESRQGRLADARRHVETFLKRAANDVTALELHASVCFDMKDYEAALAAYSALAKAHPEARSFPRDVGRAQMAAGRYADAAETYRALLVKDPTDREALRALYDASYKRGDYGQAVEALEPLARLEPKNCEPLLLLARSYHRLGRFAEARQRGARCLELEPGHSGAHFLIGWTWLGEGDLQKAKAEFAEALTGDPASVEALYWSATVELRLGGRPAAVRLLEKAVSVDPDHTSARYELARAYAAEGQPEKAAKQFEEFRRLKSREAWKPGAAGPDAAHLEDWISFANYLLGEKKPREALAVLEPARKGAPENAEVLRLTGVAHAEVGEIDLALATYAEAEKRGATALLHWARGTLHRRLGDDARALADLRQALSRALPAREGSQAHVLVASILSEQRRWPEAESDLRKALALDPRSLPALVLLAETLVRSGKPADAAREARRALAAHPDDAAARLALAGAAIAQKLFDDAEVEIARAAQSEGESARVLQARGRLAAARGNVDQAIEALGRAALADPSRGEVLALLGTQYLESRRPSEAAVSFEKATIVDPRDAASWTSLGRIYLAAKRVPAAVGYFEKAVSAAPDDAEARYQLAVALQQAGRAGEAEEAARKAKALGHPAADSLLQSLATRP
jgi:tetratricopeptide (TPR) repeat protein